ncbi:Polynucleotidyl transferase, ribonuclease H superfamily protein [Trifolium repens]|nr:Polynucleotidyl transferase, ribonuclease H superfamily protein [Trifolium repens]
MQWCREYRSAYEVRHVEKQRSLTWIGWKPLVEGWVKINMDGACKGMITAGCGSIIRDHRGNWLGGFAKHIGICSAFAAELWSALEGLHLAWRLGYRNVELDVESTVVVKVIKDGVTTSVLGVSKASSNYSSGTNLYCSCKRARAWLDYLIFQSL